jgi:hypothetical protein
MLSYGIELEQREAKIDYFATSLPSLLLFDDDLAETQKVQARSIQAAALSGLGRTAEADRLRNSIKEAEPAPPFTSVLAAGC